MGIWSSEEDLTSLVAERFRAGGYLAHFLRTAFAGEADLNGDRAIDAGELSTFVRRGMNSAEVGELEAETREGIGNYQYITVDRGGVMLDDVLFRMNGSRSMATAAPQAQPRRADYVATPQRARVERPVVAPPTIRPAARVAPAAANLRSRWDQQQTPAVRQ
jgi:hypothetical protein